MVSMVFLKTDKFEVELEGIKMKAIDFEPFHVMELLIPKGRVSCHPLVVGVDVMRHPRDKTMALLFLSFGIGCVILTYSLGEDLPDPIMNFMRDERIAFAGFGIDEKRKLFPFERLGLLEHNVDVGYLASEYYNEESLKKCELVELARKVTGIRSMVGITLTQPSCRNIKCVMSEVFISTFIARTLVKRLRNCQSKETCNSSLNNMKNLNRTTLCRESWLKTRIRGKSSSKYSPNTSMGHAYSEDDRRIHTRNKKDSYSKQKLKSILKSPSPMYLISSSNGSSSTSTPNTKHGSPLKVANSKGHNVSFKEELLG